MIILQSYKNIYKNKNVYEFFKPKRQAKRLPPAVAFSALLIISRFLPPYPPNFGGNYQKKVPQNWGI
jgi:hypothetical protein